MIKEKIKNEKGVSLISLAIVIVVLVILTNVILYNVKDNLKIGKLKAMQNDIVNLRDKVASYYAENGKIPASIKYTNIDHIKAAGVISEVTDAGDFFVIDLSALENLTLNYGKDFEIIKQKPESANDYQDVYVINEASHNVFYVAGITVDTDVFYTDYTSDEVDLATVDLRYVENVKIPEGFYYVGGTKNTGIVISDVQGDDLANTKQGNQFVWVPVENINDFHTIEGYGSGSVQSYLSKCSEPYTNGYSTEVLEYNNMKKSIEANHGFYIGRYEAGKVDNKVVVKKNVPVYNNIKWGSSMTDETGGAVELSKNFATEKGYSSVTSTLCYGVQWDATLQFIDSNYITGTCESNSYLVNSTNKGNYSGSLINTGSNDNYAVKNIYDMAGNVYEWTMEAYYTSVRLDRGGGCNYDASKYPASFRGDNNPSYSNADIGFRIALYLNNEEQWSPVYDQEGIYQDKNGDTAYIPEGFQVSEKLGEKTIDDGLVVKAPDGSEFVWVPVENINDFHTIEGYYNGSLQSRLSSCSEPYTSGYATEKSEYDLMKASVESNHGFYIGRFEAGKVDNKVVVKKNVPVYTNIKWGTSMSDTTGGAVELSKNFATENRYTSVTSTLCYGVQWDAAMQFIDNNYINGTCANDSYLRNSTNKGNYSGSLMNTGSNDNYAIKNIYDMAGNVWEWTMEAYSTTYRVLRGGYYAKNASSYPASGRGFYDPSGALDNFGFRIALYLKNKEK